MKIIISISMLLLMSVQAFSQKTDSIAAIVVSNNIELKALLRNNDADSVEIKTDKFLKNPEIGVNYLFGNPDIIGNRTDISITQEFDFPSAYKHKSKITDIKNQKLNLLYQQKTKNLIYETKLICIDLIYCNSMIKEYETQHRNAVKIADSYKRKFEAGEANILEYNKAELNKLNVSKKLEIIKIEKDELLGKLTGLNGNIPINFNDTVYSYVEIPNDFEQWYAKIESLNPEIIAAEQEIELSKNREKLSLAMSLPKFSAGYMGEFTQGQNFQGVSFSMSIPLFENKNKVKFAKLKTDAVSEQMNQSKMNYYNNMKILYNKALSMQKSLNEYKKFLNSYNNSQLLYKALEKGEIDLIDYMLELSFYYESYSNLLQLERDLNKTLAELYKY